MPDTGSQPERPPGAARPPAQTRVSHGSDRHDLPVPEAAASAHSARLGTLIGEAIGTRAGRISFEQFMALALHAPGLGYYSAGSRKFGRDGDFVTAPEISPLFSRCLAHSCRDVLARLEGGDILEVGAGSGVMAADILAELSALDALPTRYLILELSADLRARQAQTLQARVPALAGRVHWLDVLPEASFRGVVLGNELLDAMPVQRFVMRAEGPRVLCVGWQDGQFVWREEEPSDARLVERIDEIARAQGAVLSPGYVSEVNLVAEDWVRSVAGLLEAGLVLLIDYGFARHEYYHAQRREGTLLCHYRHRVHDDPLILVGLQDITAHIDFTAIAEAAHAAGLSVAGYTTQAWFLLGADLTLLIAAANEDQDSAEQLAIANQVRRLTLPHEMGELFKVIGLSRRLPGPLPGFALRDMCEKL